MGSKIEWTNEVWNPTVGCTRKSSGCDNCYAVKMTNRLEAMGQDRYAGLVNIGKNHFNGTVRTVPEVLGKPLKWRDPRRVFVNSMSDLFHEDVPFTFVDQVMLIMAVCPQHTFQVLTKRPDRMAEYFDQLEHNWDETLWSLDLAEVLSKHEVYSRGFSLRHVGGADHVLEMNRWPLPNLWLGTSVEDQKTANMRIPELLKVPAAVRFLSCEPLLSDVRLDAVVAPCKGGSYIYDVLTGSEDGIAYLPRVNWVIVGGESGPNAREFNPDWARALRDQCAEAGVAFFMKQMGGKRKPFAQIPDDLMIRQFPEVAE